MNLNLRILPLEIVENIVLQKCLLPQRYFSAYRPGAWVKCCVSGGGSTAVCRIYPRDVQGHCYLDSCTVVAGEATSSKPTLEARLQNLELLSVLETPIVSVEIVFVVTEKLFRRNVSKLTLNSLKTTAQHLLQMLHMTVPCTVRLPELADAGIEAIEVISATGCSDSQTAFTMSEETELRISNVRLNNADANATTSRTISGFEHPRHQLLDLLQMAKFKKSLSRDDGLLRLLPLNALLVGAAGSGKSTLASDFIRQHQCNCFSVTAANVLRQYPGETQEELRRIFEAARVFVQRFKPKEPTVILLDNVHLLCPVVKTTSDAGNSMRICAQLLTLVDDLSSPDLDIICLATTTAAETLNELARRPGRFGREIIISTPTAAERKVLFASLFECSFVSSLVSLTPDLLDLVVKQTQGYVIADLALLLSGVEEALLMDRTRDFSELLKQLLIKSKSNSMHSSEVTVFKTTEGFDSIGGMPQLKRRLTVSVLAGLKQQNAFQRFGLSLPKGVLLYGPPGCAKTTFAKCLATEANMTFIATSGAEVYSPYVGCAEKFVAKIFDTARKNAPCLIFLDEIDSLIGRRAIDASASSDVQIRILSTLLTEMDGIIGGTTAGINSSDKHILVVAATNRPDMVDDALLRPGRFDKLIHVPAPDFESRRSILALQAQRIPFAPEVNVAVIAERTENYSGADICNLCNEAAMQALQRDFDASHVSAKDFECVLSTLKSSLTQRQIDWYSEFENKFRR